MAEKLSALAGRAGPPLAALSTALLAAALVLALVTAFDSLGAPAVTAAATAAAEQCYAWDLVNTTGADADGITLRLTGIQSVTQVYAGDANPFGEPRPGGGYDAVNDRYELTLGANAVSVAAGESVKVGLCSPDPVLSAAMQWLAGAGALGTAVNLPALTWNWPSLEAIEVELQNTTGVTATVIGVHLLAPEAALGIDDLDAAVAANQDPAGAELDEPTQLAPGAFLALAIPLAPGGPGPGDQVMLAVEWAEGDDLLVTTGAYVVASVPDEQIYLPAVRR